MIKLKKINKCFNFEAFFQFLKNGLFWVFFSFLVVTPANFSFNKNDKNRWNQRSKSYRSIPKNRKSGEGGGKCYDDDSIFGILFRYTEKNSVSRFRFRYNLKKNSVFRYRFGFGKNTETEPIPKYRIFFQITPKPKSRYRIFFIRNK